VMTTHMKGWLEPKRISGAKEVLRDHIKGTLLYANEVGF